MSRQTNPSKVSVQQRPQLPPAGTRCQEASVLSRDSYLPCGQTAVRLVWGRDTPPERKIAYAMCASCADHNVRSRGASLVQQGQTWKLGTVGWGPPGPDNPPASRTDNSAAMGEPPVEIEETDERPTDAQLADTAAMARRMMELEDEVARLQGVIGGLNDEHKAIAEVELPKRMKLIGMTEVPLVGGCRAVLEDVMSASIHKGSRPAAYAYMKEEGAGPLVKRTLTLEFGMGEEPALKAVLAALAKIKTVAVEERVKGKKVVRRVRVDLDPAVEESVHSGSLNRWVRERKSQGKPLDPPMVAMLDRKGKPVRDEATGKTTMVPAIVLYEGTVAEIVRPKAGSRPTEGM